jgi:hypothetical protein
MASFPQASPPTSYANLYPPPYTPHALHISFVSIKEKLTTFLLYNTFFAPLTTSYAHYDLIVEMGNLPSSIPQ